MVVDFMKAAAPWIIIGLCLAFLFANTKKSSKVERPSTKNEAEDAEKKQSVIPMTMCFGVAIGVAMDGALPGSTNLGMSIGMLLGVILGKYIDDRREGQ